jgi:hypothetical protein
VNRLEAILRIQVVLSRLVYNAQISAPDGDLIGENLVAFSNFDV